MSQSKIGLEVFCKRDGTRGTVVADTGDTLTIKIGTVNKAVTRNTFNRWYTIVPQDREDADESSTLNSNTEQQSIENTNVSSQKSSRINPSGEVGIGLELRSEFLKIVKRHANQSLDFTYDEKNNRDIIKYNGKNVFECTTARRRFNVLCHSKALTPDNLRRADKIYPKSWSWVLNVKFVFTEMSQTPLMSSIVADSLFYRHQDNTDRDI